ncbi:hypothetical protein [Companilactobacillus kedongensis]|uniref:hypothetical protein n=1 Tax=Companilactobacillus kedongensis TaxID=2486004 RepID=UPI000F7719CF|nr:hypothetical protein [Companilactobacillus kedongensis]
MSELEIGKSTTLEDAKKLILRPELEKIILSIDIASEYLPILYHVFRLNRITVLGDQKAINIAPNIILDDDINNYDERAIFVEVK